MGKLGIFTKFYILNIIQTHIFNILSVPGLLPYGDHFHNICSFIIYLLHTIDSLIWCVGLEVTVSVLFS